LKTALLTKHTKKKKNDYKINCTVGYNKMMR